MITLSNAPCGWTRTSLQGALHTEGDGRQPLPDHDDGRTFTQIQDRETGRWRRPTVEEYERLLRARLGF